MKIKKKLTLFLFLFLITLTSSFIFNISMNQNKEILELKNIEALADAESDLQEILKICTGAGGFCVYKRTQYEGIHLKLD